MKKKLLGIRLILCLMFFLPSVFAQEAAPTPGPVVGEKLTYMIRWGLIPVAWATVHVRSIENYEGHKVFHIVFDLWSNSFLSAFYKIRDRVETYMDAEQFCSRKFYKRQSEGGYHAEEEMLYNQESHRAVYHSIKNGTVKEMDIPQNVQDTLSAIYYLRMQPVKVGEKVTAEVNVDEKNWTVEMNVVRLIKGKEIRRLGVFDVFYVEPQAHYEGKYEKRGRVWLWVSADRRRLPLMIKSKVPFGSVSGTLIKTEIVRDSKNK